LKRLDAADQQHSADSIVIIGGGAGGLELATKLGRKFRKSARDIILIDQNRTHIWKPLLHEVAAGSLNADVDGVDYLALGQQNGFTFHLGRVNGLDRQLQRVLLEPLIDSQGQTVLDARSVNYGTLVFALGSITNDFGTKGASEHCIFLDSPQSAERFHTRLLNEFLKLQADHNNHILEIVIVGAGATGVELAAELYKTTELLMCYGYNHLSANRLKVTLVEAGERLLPALPQRISDNTKRELEKLGVDIQLGTVVSEVSQNGLHTKDGRLIPAKMSVWAAGIKAPAFLSNIGELETNRINQLVVNYDLLTTRDINIFAIGDCAQKRDFITRKLVPTMLASTACAEARIAGMNLYNLNVVKTFSGTIAIYSTALNETGFGTAGLTEQQAKEENIEAITGIFEGINRHPGNLPDSHKQIVKLIAAKQSGVIIGGEVIGGKETGELTNVIGMAIQNRMTVNSLITMQIGTHPCLTASPAAYPLIKAAEQIVYKQINN